MCFSRYSIELFAYGKDNMFSKSLPIFTKIKQQKKIPHKKRTKNIMHHKNNLKVTNNGAIKYNINLFTTI